MSARLPAEWELQDAVWVAPPHNPQTWPGRLDDARRQFDRFMQELGRVVTVRTTDAADIPTNDSWIRDYAPLFCLEGHELIGHAFRFNAYGGKFPCKDDRAATASIAAAAGARLVEHSLTLEGGAIEVNGAGTLMTTEQCLLHPSRNPDLRQKEIENRLHEAFGTSHAVWLHAGLCGDDTDGHIDNLARFVSPRCIVAPRAPSGHVDHEALEVNWKLLQGARDQNGERFELIALPTPPPLVFDYPPDRPVQPGLQQLPASYANFLICNGRVFLPTFGQPSDAQAVSVMRRAMPNHIVVPIRSETLLIGMGGLHCLSMQQPFCE